MNYIQDIAREIMSNVDPKVLPAENSLDDLFLLYALLALTLGQSVEAADVHDAWSAWMSRQAPDHKSIVPSKQLDADALEEDRPFVTAIRVAARKLDLQARERV